MTAARYQIQIQNKVIYVALRGDWHPAIDLAYLSELTEAIRSVRNKKWALLVDMRECHIHANNVAGQYAEMSADRRNQAQEVWIVDRADQGDFFLNLGSTAQLKVHKCFSLADGESYLMRQGFLPHCSPMTPIESLPAYGY